MKVRRSKEDWRELILRQAESGLSAQQFCRNNNVCPKYFSIRKKQLGLRSSAFLPVLSSKRIIPVAPITLLKFTSLVLRHGECCLHFEATIWHSYVATHIHTHMYVQTSTAQTVEKQKTKKERVSTKQTNENYI